VSTHEHYMQQAIELAKNAEGCTSPNPLVGCVVVNNDVVVGTGWHRAAGDAHAEAVALKQAGKKSSGATLYVCLEPCSHFGRTPPCVNAIIEAEIKCVVYALADPNPTATGGAKLLENAGIQTIPGILEKEARQLNRYYLHHHKFHEPYVVAKFASSLDGRIATRSGQSKWITCDASRQRAHYLRQSVDAIVVGLQTVIDDNPSLTVRLEPDTTLPIKQPLRIVLDSQGRIPLECHLLSSELAAGTLVATTSSIPTQRKQSIRDTGAEVICISNNDEGRVDISSLLAILGERGIQSIMVEGGAAVLGAFFDTQRVSEVWAFVAPLLIGGKTAPGAIGGNGVDQLQCAARLKTMRLEQIGSDILVRGQTDFIQELH